MNRESCKYTPYYCEENIWHLCREPLFAGKRGYVLFVSNRQRQCIFYNQILCSPSSPVIWDYHVVLLSFDSGWFIWDLDSSLSFPSPLRVYLDETFPEPVPEKYAPLFNFAPMEDYIKNFCSDRSHMLDAQGRFIEPPPLWPPIRPELGNNVDHFIAMNGSGRHYSLSELKGGLRCLEG